MKLSIHALNAIYLKSIDKWIRIDARGNKEGIQADFSIDNECLAFPIRKEYDEIDDALLKFAVVIAKTDGRWIFCKHKERDTYEVPGGHREVGENIIDTAKRELREETGAIDFDIKPVCVYSVKGKTRVVGIGIREELTIPVYKNNE